MITLAVFTGTIPTGLGFWRGTNPSQRTAGTWRTWVISSGSEYRPPPPPAFGLAQQAQELAEVKNFPRPIPASSANFNTTRAACAYALMFVAAHDGLIACWDLLGWEVHLLGGAPQHA